jgi:hypothetical protein
VQKKGRSRKREQEKKGERRTRLGAGADEYEESRKEIV